MRRSNQNGRGTHKLLEQKRYLELKSRMKEAGGDGSCLLIGKKRSKIWKKSKRHHGRSYIEMVNQQRDCIEVGDLIEEGEENSHDQR